MVLIKWRYHLVPIYSIRKYFRTDGVALVTIDGGKKDGLVSVRCEGSVFDLCALGLRANDRVSTLERMCGVRWPQSGVIFARWSAFCLLI